MSKAKNVSRKSRRPKKPRVFWVGDDFVCGCGSDRFRIRREQVARKVHTRTAHRRRFVAICGKGHKHRIAFPPR